jgi:hypothetical protein
MTMSSVICIGARISLQITSPARQCAAQEVTHAQPAALGAGGGGGGAALGAGGGGGTALKAKHEHICI